MVERITIPECPAFRICRMNGMGCEICLQLSPEAWREHVRAVRLKK